MNENQNNLAEWVETYTDELFSWAQFKLSDAELAKDLVQDTFLAAAEKLSSFKGESSPKTWLFSILNFKIIDVYRKKSKKMVHAESFSLDDFFDEDGSWRNSKRPKSWDDDDDDSHLLDDDDFQAVLKHCLDALPEKWNAIMKLKYLMNIKGEDICQELEITTTNFWQIMHRAKINLRECLDSNWFEKK